MKNVTILLASSRPDIRVRSNVYRPRDTPGIVYRKAEMSVYDAMSTTVACDTETAIYRGLVVVYPTSAQQAQV